MNKKTEAFDLWWEREGSGMVPVSSEEAVRRVCKIAWLEGAYFATTSVLDSLQSLNKETKPEGGGEQ